MATRRKKKPEKPENKASGSLRVSAEEYTVLARRYRPQQFADLVGQEPVARALVNALKSNRVAHAYLFTGARGVGKTSTARILAKALNCAKGPTPTPCDVCDMCRGIASGDDVDVLEIDGASNRGIDEVREIRSNVQYRPSRARYKIYIIDEVHMLTAAAFNALLKTLEEPPPHVKFIFATTDAHKIPITILSRCQRFDFAGIGTPAIVARLREIVTLEGMQADDEALALVARRAGRSMRDAQSLLDQLLAFSTEHLSVEQVHHLLGTANDDRVAALAAAVLEHDPKRALELLGQAADAGLQLGELLDQLVDYWRDLMIANCGSADRLELSIGTKYRDVLIKQAGTLELETILAGLDVLETTKARMRGSSHGRVLLEMALVRLARLENLVPLAQLANWLATGCAGSGSPLRTAPAAGAGASLSAGAASNQSTLPSLAASLKKLAEDISPPAPATTPVLSAESLPKVWQDVLGQVSKILASHLEKAGLPIIAGPSTLVLRFADQYNSERKYCEEPARLERILGALRRVAGPACQLRVESGGGNGRDSQPVNNESDSGMPGRPRRPLADLEKEPLIHRAIEVLGARFVPSLVEEGFGVGMALSESRTGETSGEQP